MREFPTGRRPRAARLHVELVDQSEDAPVDLRGQVGPGRDGCNIDRPRGPIEIHGHVPEQPLVPAIEAVSFGLPTNVVQLEQRAHERITPRGPRADPIRRRQDRGQDGAGPHQLPIEVERNGGLARCERHAELRR